MRFAIINELRPSSPLLAIPHHSTFRGGDKQTCVLSNLRKIPRAARDNLTGDFAANEATRRLFKKFLIQSIVRRLFRFERIRYSMMISYISLLN